MMDIATWAQENFVLSDNDFPVCHYIKKYNLKLYYATNL